MTKVNIKVREKGINKTVKDLLSISKKMNGVVVAITEEGAKYCKENAPVYSGDLKNSIYGGVTSYYHGLITTYSEHAKYAEYGIGIVGQTNPHPNIDTSEYDINKHGSQCWTYYDDYAGQYRHTTGYVGNQFMYKTRVYLENNFARLVRAVFRK